MSGYRSRMDPFRLVEEHYGAGLEEIARRVQGLYRSLESHKSMTDSHYLWSSVDPPWVRWWLRRRDRP